MSRDEPNAGAIAPSQDPDAVMLDFMQPAVPRQATGGLEKANRA
jgi:hypothetical protein